MTDSVYCGPSAAVTPNKGVLSATILPPPTYIQTPYDICIIQPIALVNDTLR